MEDELRAEPAHGLDLDAVRAFGDADRRPDAEEPSGEGDRLPVVSGRGCDDSALPLAVRELGDEIDAAPDLEGADRLVVLVLQEDVGSEQLVETCVAIERSRSKVRCDATARHEDVGQCGDPPLHPSRDGS